MKLKIWFFSLIAVALAVAGCSDDEKVARKGDPDITHEGEKWNIATIDTYTLMDVSGMSVVNKTGSRSNAGSFYFNDAETKGSFEFEVEGYNKEDFFTFTKSDDGAINIVSIEQSVGSTTNQNIVAISGNQISDTEIVLDVVSITKQSSLTGIFTFTAVSITLTKP